MIEEMCIKFMFNGAVINLVQMFDIIYNKGSPTTY